MLNSSLIERKTILIFILLFIFFSFSLSAQNDTPDVDDWDDFGQNLRGDQSFIISLGPYFPTLFYNNGTRRDMNFSPNIGGGGSLAYSYFFNSRVFIGVELSIMFYSSRSKDSLFLLPIGFRGGYQFNAGRFEFPISAGLGVSFQRFLSSGYFGMYTRLGASALFKATTRWGFGLSADWFMFPQWTHDKKRNMTGNFVDISISARYSF